MVGRFLCRTSSRESGKEREIEKHEQVGGKVTEDG